MYGTDSAKWIRRKMRHRRTVATRKVVCSGEARYVVPMCQCANVPMCQCGGWVGGEAIGRMWLNVYRCTTWEILVRFGVCFGSRLGISVPGPFG